MPRNFRNPRNCIRAGAGCLVCFCVFQLSASVFAQSPAAAPSPGQPSSATTQGTELGEVDFFMNNKWYKLQGDRVSSSRRQDYRLYAGMYKIKQHEMFTTIANF
jgi:hypothetical protein